MEPINGLHGIEYVENHVKNQPISKAAAVHCAGCIFVVIEMLTGPLTGQIQKYCSLSRHEYETCWRSEYYPDGLEGTIRDRYQKGE